MVSKFLIFLTLCHVVYSYQFVTVGKGEWELYKISYKKHYEAVEDQFRMNIFMQNKIKIIEHNKLYERNLTSYQMAVNQFSDKLQGEILHGLRMDLQAPVGGETFYQRGSSYIPPNEDIVLPNSVDWTTKGVVTPVKNQEDCGSCWAFAATGALEGQNARKTGELVSLSEQELLDCCPEAGGCEGGRISDAFQCILRVEGIESETNYPYEVKNGTCRLDQSMIVATDTGYVELPEGDEEMLMKAVATVGPISVGILALGSLYQYSSGVYYEPECIKTPGINHAVLLVGFGTENGEDYWLVKNSWGEKWGEEGYAKMARNSDNNCRIASYATYPLV